MSNDNDDKQAGALLLRRVLEAVSALPRLRKVGRF
jgi:hypothetical protein